MKKLIFELHHHSPIKLFGMSYYAVAKGRNPGVYRSWDECKEQTHKFPGAVFKKFGLKTEAENFVETGGTQSSSFDEKGKGSSRKIVSRFHPYSKNATKKNTTNENGGEAPDMEELRRFMENKIRTDDEIDDRVDIFTDGACSNNGQQGAKAGYGVFFGENHTLNIAKPVIGRATNNNAEIQAVTEAASLARKYGMTKIRIHTDSQFLINCITKWMPAWKRRNWKTSSNQPVINKKELMEMEEALAPLDVEFNHVKGHTGIPGNEEADRLARLGAESYKS